jgi:hypothetical protein
MHLDNLVFHSIYKRDPLKGCDVYYGHEMSVYITKILWLSHQEFERCYLGITEGRYLSDMLLKVPHMAWFLRQFHDHRFRHSSDVKIITASTI